MAPEARPAAPLPSGPARGRREGAWRRPRGSSGLHPHELPGPLFPPLIGMVSPHLLVAGGQGQSALPGQYLRFSGTIPKGPMLGEEEHTVSRWVTGGGGEWSHLCPPPPCFLAPGALAGDTGGRGF